MAFRTIPPLLGLLSNWAMLGAVENPIIKLVGAKMRNRRPNKAKSSVQSSILALTIILFMAEPEVLAQNYGANEAAGENNSPAYALPQRLADTYWAFVDQIAASADEIPKDVALRMHRLVGRPGIPFNHDDIDSARYVSASTPQGKFLFPLSVVGARKMTAITHDRLIVMAPEEIHPSDCKGYAVWAHEVTHISQYRREGRDQFIRKYLSDATKYDYEKIPYEVAAHKVEDIVAGRYCELMDGLPVSK